MSESVALIDLRSESSEAGARDDASQKSLAPTEKLKVQQVLPKHREAYHCKAVKGVVTQNKVLAGCQSQT